MRTGGGQPTRPTRIAGLGLAILALTVLAGAAPSSVERPARVLPLIPDQPQNGAGAFGLDAFGLLLLAGLGLAVAALVVAVFVLFRTRGAKAIPPPSEGWWTCANCGAGNIDGASRCHKCATWRTTSSPTTSPSP